ncbi:developmental regulator [Moniliophthora roreri]|uniref:Velvet domain-containing protein n=1 Tax=Moniliophthora roreri TaxID=221103 RepID=A0A0W0GAS0_MONRR|nr:developmental regulator [Moniliophthora roreri]
MIQLINTPRQTGSEIRQIGTDGPEQWGKWSGRKHYSLEVIQHPLRARMCGFGDKDRRPLAPAAVAKMIVRRDDNSLVEVDDVDCSFFVVTVDLWSADGTQEMNLVLHPSSADRYIPPHATNKPRRSRGMSVSASQPQPRSSGYQTPVSRSTPTPSHNHYRNSDNSSMPPQTPGYTHPPSENQGGYFGPPPPTTDPYANPGAGSESGHPTWGYPSSQVDRNTPYPPPILPSIHTFGRSNTPHNGKDSWQTPAGPWGNTTDSSSAFDIPNANIDPNLRDFQDGFPGNNTPYDSYPQQYPQQPAHQAYYQSNNAPQNGNGNTSQAQASVGMALPRHTYTRTLVGPLSANATRLLDEHRKPGIFFLFQDLSVRTEGTFRLRMRLMNVGASPAPESGSVRIHTEVSPVLAQTFTEPFTVYSAKRFPGVPDTTALSIAFGNQGQKLPLRNRNGTSGGKRRRHDSDSDDSDGA